ncbi:hypothetical protein BDU57DRAFT_80307 [Ampelomyces quisqualis]|uniref:Uncharacterized protein n=1 Tax=Ampelomyces quisqualis TaxID=50730 RepID=A0A6A5Q9M5_AMPQU|nr:hypothetical protein BDU57DRAFT_80307 [Ampelomyces quisqualis]
MSPCKAQSAYARNPDGWFTHRPSSTSRTGSYRDITAYLRLAISPPSTSRHSCGHWIRVSLSHSSTRPCQSLAFHGLQPCSFPCVHFLMPGC